MAFRFARAAHRVFAVIACLALVVPAASAANVTWTGAVNSNWSNGGNWDTATAPVTGDDVFLVNGGANPSNYDLVGVTLHSITNTRTSPVIGGNDIALQSGGSITDNLLSAAVFNTNIVLNGPVVLTGFDTVYSGVISGTGPVTVQSSDTNFTFNNVNTYSGSTILNATVLAAKLVPNVTGAIPSGSAVVIVQGSLALGPDQTIGSLAGAGRVFLGDGDLTVGGDNTSTTYSGNISNNGPFIHAFTKTGTGTLTLSGSSAHTGPMFVNAGGLEVTGSTNSTTTVNAGAVLSGTGTIIAPVTIAAGATLALAQPERPGSSARATSC
jgi:autotransporter-associated beta strand protein